MHQKRGSELSNDATAAAGVGLMIGSPVAQTAKVPFVQIVIFDAQAWQFTVGDLGFVIGAILAAAKLIQLIRPGCKECRHDKHSDRHAHSGAQPK